MASPPFDFGETDPGDSDIVSQHPPNERSMRDNVADWTDFEHGMASGRHKIPKGTVAARDAITDWEAGSFWIDTDETPNVLEMNLGTKATPVWVTVGPTGVIPSGGKIAFFQASVPVGWTLDPSQHDKVLRVVDDTGGGEGGSWTISGVTVDGHELIAGEMLPHKHESPVPNNDSCNGDSRAIGSLEGNWPHGSTTNRTYKFGPGTVIGNDCSKPSFLSGPIEGTSTADEHVHTLTSDAVWRPAYIDVIIGTKD